MKICFFHYINNFHWFTFNSTFRHFCLYLLYIIFYFRCYTFISYIYSLLGFRFFLLLGLLWVFPYFILFYYVVSSNFSPVIRDVGLFWVLPYLLLSYLGISLLYLSFCIIFYHSSYVAQLFLIEILSSDYEWHFTVVLNCFLLYFSLISF